MDLPFIYGKIVSGSEFTNRKKEVEKLVTNFQSGINTTIISPRRWGKSSLVSKAATSAMRKDKQLKVCFIDIFNLRSEEEFYEELAGEVLQKTSSKWDEIMENTKRFLNKFIPKISFSPEPNSELSLSLDWKEVKKNPDEILDLAEKIAAEKELNVVICIDEFQNISEFENPKSFQKKLRSHWQKHKHVSYCLYGSKRHMMMEVFISSSMPFYKFGDLIFLQKIEERYWVTFIPKRFKATGKIISKELAKLIAQLAENHPYYVQQLAQQAWLRTKKTCTEENVRTAHESIAMQLSMLFQSLTDNLTSSQVNLLKAVLDGEEHLTSKSTVEEYKLGTSATAVRSRQALITKEILDNSEGELQFLDPFYKFWLKTSYFI